MPAGPWLDTSRPVFLPDPVHRHHPLNRGRTGWWPALPPLDGGRQLYDLHGLYHGTLTSMTGAGNGWRSQSPGGLGGSLATDGTAGYVDFGTPAGLNGATNCSWAGWMWKASNAVSAAMGATGGIASGGTGARFAGLWFTDGNFYCSISSGGSGPFGSVAVSGFGWHRFLCAYDGTQTGNANRLQVYIDGKLQSLSFTATIPATLGACGPFAIGRDATDRYSAGLYADPTLWAGRTLAAADAAADYDLARRGYPGALSRVRSRVAVLMGAPGGGVGVHPWWLYATQQVIGAPGNV
jgi:hypothetical protein